MNETNIRQALAYVRSSRRKMNHLWDGATGSDHTWLCRAYEDTIKAQELLERELSSLEQFPEQWFVNLYESEES